MYEYIPEELRQLSQWVCHKYPSKIPLCACPDAGGILHPASCNKPATWCSFGQAVRAVKEHGATGIGIQFANGICGIDIDDCVDGGELTAFAREIVETMHSYTEVSPSGTGIHILCKGRLPAREGRRDSSLGLEMYDTGRYFTVTGSAYLDPSGRPYPLRDCTKELDEIHRKYLTPEPVEQTRLDAPKPAAARTPDSRQAVRDLSDQEILEIAFRNKETGEDVRRLYAGDWSSLPQLSGKSQSEADLLFCGHLAFWFDRDGARMDTVFRASGLYRKKWDEKRGAQTYGQKTIAAAIKGTTRTFVPYDRPRGGEKPLPEPPPDLLRESRGRFLGARNPLNRHRSSRTRGGIRWTTPATPTGSGMPSGGTSDTTMSMAVGCTGPASGGRWMKQGRSSGGRIRCLSGWKRRHARFMTTGACSSMSARPAAANIKRR